MPRAFARPLRRHDAPFRTMCFENKDDDSPRFPIQRCNHRNDDSKNRANEVSITNSVSSTTTISLDDYLSRKQFGIQEFLRETKLTGPNFIDWYTQLRLVLLTEDKENYLEHLIHETPVAPPGQQVPFAAAVAHTAQVKGKKEVVVLMLLTMDLDIQQNLAHLGSYDMLCELKAMFSKQAEQELLQTVREFYACKQEEVSLILVSLNKDYDSFVQNYNMHDMGKTVNELHAMIKLHEDTLPKKDANPALHAIQAGRVQKNQKNKPHKAAKGVMGLWGSKKLKPGTLSLYVGDSHRVAVEAIKTYHLELPNGLVIVLNNCHYVPSITIVSKNNLVYFMAVPWDGISEIDISCSNTNDSSMYFKREIENQLGKTIKSLRSDRRDMVRSMMSQTTLPKSFWDYALETAARILNMVPSKKVFVKRDTLTKPDKLDPRSFRCIFVGYPKETIGYSFYNPSENKVFIARNAEFFEDDLIDLKASGSVEDLELIQEEDTNPYLDTSLDHEEDDQEINEPQGDINPIRKSFRTRRAPDHMCLDIDAEEHELGNLGELANYKAVLLDPESKKWLDAMNQVALQEKTDMDCAVYVFKARLVVKGLHSNLRDVKSYLGRSLAMKDLEDATYILGIKIYRDRRETIQIQEKLKLSKSQGASTPAEKQHMQIVPYASAIGSIMYAVRCNMERELRVFCYTDAGYLTDVDDLKSQTGYVFVLNGGAVNWKSTKQSFFATSSTYAEYITAFDASKEAVWIRKFISGLVKDDGVSKGARHFRAKVHYLRETIKLGDVKIEKVDTDDNLADHFTKALAFPKHYELTRNIGMLPASSFM
uniref:Zinc finger, CCHC-type n=1 Tax=Tanacetum cinerariifolium TaxID=118510 RepID=A0A6L2L3S1_TANCI|nr:zinc finger, CCHC-type [Tanacetum cinerariifolium]